MKADLNTTIEYVSNPKRVGFNAHARYEIYQTATTVGEYLDICAAHDLGKYAKADMKYDYEKGFLTIMEANTSTDLMVA